MLRHVAQNGCGKRFCALGYLTVGRLPPASHRPIHHPECAPVVGANEGVNLINNPIQKALHATRMLDSGEFGKGCQAEVRAAEAAFRFGEWMRFKTDTVTDNGNIGRKASEAPAYIQDFASLKIKC